MMGSFAGVFMGLLGVIPLVAQWIGLMAMRDQKNGAWWTMMVGTALQSLGTIGTIVFLVQMMTGWRSPSAGSAPGFAETAVIMIVAGIAAAGGALAFAAGFAMHGLQRRAARDREEQLEAMAVAMAEESRELRERHG
jgi:hypothetical protein